MNTKGGAAFDLVPVALRLGHVPLFRQAFHSKYQTRRVDIVRWFLASCVIITLAVPLGEIPDPLGAQIGVAKSPLQYEIAFPNVEHHEAEITITYRDLNPGPLELRMSRSSPGRYALHEFAKNVYAVRATTEDGAPLALDRPNPHQWNVLGHRGFVRVTYTLFGDRADGHVLRNRPDTRASQYAGHVHVGSRARGAPDSNPISASRRESLAGGHATLAHGRSFSVRGARLGLFHG